MLKKLFLPILITALLITAFPVHALSGETAPGGRGVYSDISGVWCRDAIEKYGYPEIFADETGTFRPGKAVTRMEFVRLMHKALGITFCYFAEPDISEVFSDMSKSDTGALDLYDLVTAGIIGKSDTFSPDKPLERQVMARWLIRALGYRTSGNYPLPSDQSAVFRDWDEISPDFRADVRQAAFLKLMNGRGDGLFCPHGSSTRGEAVTVTSRLLTLLQELSGGVTISAKAAEDGGALVMTFTVRNDSRKDVSILHPSGQKFDMELSDEKGNILYRWSTGKLFTEAQCTTVIRAGSELQYKETLESAEYSAIRGEASSFRAYLLGTSDDFYINPNGYTG